MKNTVIIIPTRLDAKRFPNKPLAHINNIPMIVHVLNRAQESQVGQVYVATPDKEIISIITKNKGQAILTKSNHHSGSDRIYEAYLNNLENKADLIINLQGDMPNIKPTSIIKLVKLMRENKSDIGTLVSPIKDTSEINDSNIVKAQVEEDLNNKSFVKVSDFFREKKDVYNKKVYHHIGIYAFTSDALTKYVKLPRSKLEIKRNLEQMRAMENNMLVKVGLVEGTPLGIDTRDDLEKIKKEMIL
jgi:3-deoxy-manno-octulosonate cytidylyltransferase (CMP-KDO synthetase)